MSRHVNGSTDPAPQDDRAIGAGRADGYCSAD